MNDSDPSPHLPDASISEALELMWVRYQPQILERVAVLEAAASAVTATKFTASECEAAHAAAHKLAGSLGMFNLERGTDVARELEAAYALESPPSPDEADRLVSLAAELRAMIENRKPGIENRKPTG
jgi:HPt (histidine-containing phosphotransfer) domain-containing protein